MTGKIRAGRMPAILVALLGTVGPAQPGGWAGSAVAGADATLQKKVKPARPGITGGTARSQTAGLESARAGRRDPFQPLMSRDRPGMLPERLPPGKAGLIVSSVRVEGAARGPGGMIAVVSGPQERVYFLREGDQLYDGRVGRITLEAVSFLQKGRDAFGRLVEQTITKRIYRSAGEQP